MNDQYNPNNEPKLDDIFGSKGAVKFMYYWNMIPKFFRYWFTNLFVTLIPYGILYIQGIHTTAIVIAGTLLKASYDVLLPYLKTLNIYLHRNPEIIKE